MDIKPKFINIYPLRKAESHEEMQDTYIFFENLLQSVVGHKIWRKGKYNSLISEIVTPSQEALALWIINNYEDMWNPIFILSKAKYTCSNTGNSIYKGWRKEGLEKYNELCAHVKQNRDEDLEFEEEFKKAMKQKTLQGNPLLTPHSIGEGENNPIATVVTYNDFSEEEDAHPTEDPKDIYGDGGHSTKFSLIGCDDDLAETLSRESMVQV